MSRFEDSPERGSHRLLKTSIILITGLLILKECVLSDDPEVPDFGDRPAWCVDLTENDTFSLRVTEVPDDSEGPEEHAPDFTAIGFVEHPVQGEDEELRKLAECYFEDPNQGLAAAIAGGTANTKNRLFLTLTNPFRTKKGSGQDIAESLLLSESVAESAAKKSERAKINTDIVPFQPEIEAPRGGTLSFVVKHDTLSAIARTSGVTLGQLLGQNSETFTDSKESTNMIFPGMIVRVPKKAPIETPVDPTERRIKAITEFINQYGETFIDRLDGKLPVDAVITQAIHESGFGLSPLAVDAHNFFGIKAGKGWEGETYDKQTFEELTPAQAKTCFATDPTCKKMQELDNGNIVVSKIAVFRKYKDLAACLDDYFVKIRKGYPDAAAADSANYLALLVDKDDPKENRWATDSKYADRLKELHALVIPVFQAFLDMPDNEPVEPTEPNVPNKFPIASPDKVELSQKYIDSLKDVSLSREGYDRAIANIFDATKIVDAHPNGVGFHKLLNPPQDIEMVTNHFTAVLLGDKDPAKFAEHYLNGAKGKGMHFAVMRDGTIVRFVNPNLADRPSQNPPYNQIAVAAEVDADTQDNITPEQTEALIYLNWMVLKQAGLQNLPLKNTVYGHAQLRMADGIVKGTTDASGKKGTFDERSDWPTREMAAYIDLMERGIASGALPQ